MIVFMYKKPFIVGVVIVALCGILTWAPWLSDIEVKQRVQQEAWFTLAHPPESVNANPEIHVMVVPFGRYVSTYEFGEFIWFWE